MWTAISPSPLLETDTETFTQLWQQNCLGGFLFGKAALNLMLPQAKGTIIFTGATASLRARPPFTGFCCGESGFARLGARHGAGVFSTRHPCRTYRHRRGDRRRPGKKPIFRVRQSQRSRWLIKARSYRGTYWAIHNQHPSAWTHELDLRPYKEPF